MIQVIKRCFRVLELLKEHGTLSLAELEEKTQINKGTLCNILKTLVELGYARKRDWGEYMFAAALYDLTASAAAPTPLLAAGRQRILELILDVREGALGVLREGDRFYRFTKAYCVDDEMVSENALTPVPICAMAASWTLLATQPDRDIEDLARLNGYPIHSIHGDFDTFDALLKALRETSIDPFHICGLRGRASANLAIVGPVRAPNGDVNGTISLSVPKRRFVGRYKDDILNRLSLTISQLERDLS